MTVLGVQRPLRRQTGSGAGGARSKNEMDDGEGRQVWACASWVAVSKLATAPEQVYRLLLCSFVTSSSQLKVRADVGRPHASPLSETAAAL